MYHYRYVHDVPVVFTTLLLAPNPGDEIESESLIDHPYWLLIESESIVTEAPAVPEVIEPTEQVIATASPVPADTIKEQ